jgi:hypothetical protein
MQAANIPLLRTINSSVKLTLGTGWRHTSVVGPALLLAAESLSVRQLREFC